MTPTDLADILDAIAKQPAVPLRDIRGELRSAAQMLREMAGQVAQHRTALKLIADNLGEYIDRKSQVDVTVALAFETARSCEDQP